MKEMTHTMKCKPLTIVITTDLIEHILFNREFKNIAGKNTKHREITHLYQFTIYKN